MSVISIEQLTKQYGRRNAIDRIDLHVEEGTLFGILGPNGSGKTTMIRLLLGLLKPTGGGAKIFGWDCWRHSRRIKAETGYLPGDLRLYPWLTCRRAARIFGPMRKRDLSGRYEELAGEFELDPDVPVREMSRGMRQKLGLILALAPNPRLLILDEPTTALDPLMQDRLYDRLRSLASAGHTIFFSSHTLSEVEQLCEIIAILREGQLATVETVEELRARAVRPITIQWDSNVNPDTFPPPEFLTIQNRTDRQWQAALTGDLMELIRWSAEQPIENLSIGDADMNRVFRDFYSYSRESQEEQ